MVSPDTVQFQTYPEVLEHEQQERIHYNGSYYK